MPIKSIEQDFIDKVDVCPVQFSNLEANRQEIVDYLGANIQRVLKQ